MGVEHIHAFGAKRAEKIGQTVCRLLLNEVEEAFSYVCMCVVHIMCYLGVNRYLILLAVRGVSSLL